MMGTRGPNWARFAMLAVFLVIHEPIWLYLAQDTTSILRAIPVVAYIIVAAVLLTRGGLARDEACSPFTQAMAI